MTQLPTLAPSRPTDDRHPVPVTDHPAGYRRLRAREELRVLTTQLLAETTSSALDGEPNGRPLRTGWTSVRIPAELHSGGAA